MAEALIAPDSDGAGDQLRNLILVRCSAVIPTRILAKLLGLDELTIQRRRARLGIHQGIAEGKKITSAFLRTLPDLSELPLDLAQRREVAILRQHWIANRRGDIEELDRQEEIVSRLLRVLPTAALAGILNISVGAVQRIKDRLELSISRAEHTKLMHRFAAEVKCPKVGYLSTAETVRLREVWQIARAKKVATTQKRQKKTAEYAQALLATLVALRETRLAADGNTPRSQCSGACGMEWPRDKEFFIPNFRSPDGLGNRCVYCTFVTRAEARAAGRWGVRKSRGLRLRGEARLRVVAIFKAYLRIVPSGLLRQLFRLSEASTEHLILESGIELSREDRRRIYWRWYFTPVTRDLPLLSETELARLFLLTKAWHARIAKRFEPDPDHVAFMNAERARIISAAWTGPGSERPAERKCRCCGAEYPLHLLFFKRDRDWLSTACRPCDNALQQRRRLKKYRRRYG